MKNFLRNIALGGALALAGTAMADAPFTVEQVYNYAVDGYTDGDFRAVTGGYQGNIYVVNASTQKLMKFGPEGLVDAAFRNALGANCRSNTIDMAGNVIYHSGDGSWFNVGEEYTIIPADGSDPVVLNIDFTLGAGDEGKAIKASLVGKRADFLGQVLGDVMSEEGGIILFGAQNSPYVYAVYVVEGVQEELDTRYPYCNLPAEITVDTSTFIWPVQASIEDYLDDINAAVKTLAVRKRGNGYAQGVEDGEYVKFIQVGASNLPEPGTTTTDGFGCFVLGDVLYQILPFSSNAKAEPHQTRFTISDTEGNVYYTAPENANHWTAGQSWVTYSIEYVDEYTVNVYQCGLAGGNHAVFGMYTVKAPKPAGEELPALYLRGAGIQGWDNVAQFNVVDGKYVYHVESASAIEFKISTSGSTNWDEFNAGVIGIGEDNVATTIVANTDYVLTAGKLGNTVVNPGVYDITVTLADGVYTLNVDGTPAGLPETVYLVGQLEGHEWQPQNALACDSANKGVYTWNNVAFSGTYFRFITVQSADWDGVVNKATCYGATSDGADAPLNTPIEVIYTKDNAWKLAAAGHYQLVLNVNTMTLTISDSSAVESIVAENDSEAAYYNLQGVRVAGKLASGVYVKVANGKASKVLVK